MAWGISGQSLDSQPTEERNTRQRGRNRFEDFKRRGTVFLRPGKAEIGKKAMRASGSAPTDIVRSRGKPLLSEPLSFRLTAGRLLLAERDLKPENRGKRSRWARRDQDDCTCFLHYCLPLKSRRYKGLHGLTCNQSLQFLRRYSFFFFFLG